MIKNLESLTKIDYKKYIIENLLFVTKIDTYYSKEIIFCFQSLTKVDYFY